MENIMSFEIKHLELMKSMGLVCFWNTRVAKGRGHISTLQLVASEFSGTWNFFYLKKTLISLGLKLNDCQGKE